MKKIFFFSGQATPSCTSSADRTGGRGTAGRLGLAAGLALCMLGLGAGPGAAVAASSPQESALRPAEEWGTTQMPSATPNRGQLSIERDEKTGDIEMNITAPRQNVDPNAWQQPPIYLAPQVYPGTGGSGAYPPGYQPGYQPGYRPGYRPGYHPGYRPGYPSGYPGRPPSGQTGWPGAPSRPWPPTSGQYPSSPGQNTGQHPSYPGTGQYPNQNPGGLYPPPTDGWHWYPGYQGDKGPYPPGVMPLNEGMGTVPGTSGMTPGTGMTPYSRMPSFRRR